MKKNNEHDITIEAIFKPEVEEKVDVEAYFQRIGYTGERTPTLDTLRAIHALHPEAIAFENLNPFLQRLVHLDIEAIEKKLVQEGRGGYCFEHNLLLQHVLETLGFKVKGLAARVVWNMPEGVITPRGHMLLFVEIDDQPFIADVGFGGMTLTAPLLLKTDIEQETPHEPFRLIREEEIFVLQVKIKGVWKPLYCFDLQEQQLPDYKISSWYLSTYPESHFVTGLIAARTTPDRRYALRNNELAVHHLRGSTDRHIIASVPALRSTLEEIFKLNLAELFELDAALQRLIRTLDKPLH